MNRTLPSASAQALLLELLDKPGDTHPGILDARCGQDAALRTEVEALLERVAAADRWLDTLGRKLRSAPSSAADMADEDLAPPRAPAQRLGPWRLERLLGRGGMGSVWLGERDDGAFEQQVAIKFLDGGLASPAMIARFEAERRILAGLDHPNIARLLDGGVTDRGLPYFVMEYVQGEPVDRYCDRNHLSIGARLDLIGQVLNAVQYAHRNLVVHRDLKPSNILVTASGTAKLLDFGIAKVLDPDGPASAPSLLTRLGARPMTLAYASPEQCRGDRVTTASDVYALGVLLYRLLTGRSPYRVPDADPDALRQAVCEQDPVSPSKRARWSADGEEQTPEVLASLRGTTPKRLSRRLRGDLETICLTALKKMPERRYGTVEQLAADLARHRDGLPVHARPDAWSYRTAKFIGRHRFGVSVAVLAPVLAMAGLLVHLDRVGAERDRALLEAERTSRVVDYLVSLFEHADPAQARGAEINAADLVRAGTERLEALDEAPLVQAEMLKALALVNRALLEFETAGQLLDRALEILEQTPGARPTEIAEILVWRGRVEHDHARYAQAEDYHRRALELLESSTEGGPVTALAHNHLAIALGAQRSFEDSEAHFLKALARYRELSLREGIDEILNNLGVMYFTSGRYADAHPLFAELFEARVATLGEDHPLTLISMRNLAAAEMELGRLESAEALYLRALPLEIRIYGADHPRIGAVFYRLGRIAFERGQLDDAEAHFLEALGLRIEGRGRNQPSVASLYHWLGRVSAARGDHSRAVERLEESLEIYRTLFGEEHGAVGEVTAELAAARAAAGPAPPSQ